MQGKLQKTYKVSRELECNACFSGVILLSQMPRLAGLVFQNDDDVEIKVNFEFEKSDYQQAAIKGHINADLTVECQRCLGSMVHSVDQKFILLIDATEEDIQSFEVDSVFTSEGYLDAFEVIEDGLILTLPIIMMHEDTSCNKYLQPEVPEARAVEQDNPFAVLKSLKGN